MSARNIAPGYFRRSSSPADAMISGSVLKLAVLAGAIMWSMTTVVAATRPDAGQDQPEIEHGLLIAPSDSGAPERLDLPQALQRLHIPSVSIALIDGDRIARAAAYGDATPRTLYQAASMSKLVAAAAAMCLVRQGRLGLDRDVDDELASWQIPASGLTRGNPVTLRGLLSMTAGLNVPGYIGYAPGAPLPDLKQILDGASPANSPPVRVVYVPGSRYAYSGGGYEVAQALVENAARTPYADAVSTLVLRPLAMIHSFFGQPTGTRLSLVVTGHLASGAPVPGGWRAMPELAAGGLWSTPTDLARLLIAISLAYKGEDDRFLDRAAARQMLTPQNGGPYGLGAAVDGTGRALVLMKRGQNVGYQGYMLIFPATGQGIVVMTNSDNGTVLATALIRRAAMIFHWPELGALRD